MRLKSLRAMDGVSETSAALLLDADDSIDDVFFPDSGVISVVAVYADGNVIEMATIGREGCTWPA
jgi:hypothetical protein